MAKSADAFRTISEVADWLETPAHVLRFWESKFSHVKPVKRAGGRRYYRPADMLLLGGIKKLLHDEGMTIKGVQKILREKGVKHVAGFSQVLDDATDVEESNIALDVTPEPETETKVVNIRSRGDTSARPSVPPPAEGQPVTADTGSDGQGTESDEAQGEEADTPVATTPALAEPADHAPDTKGAEAEEPDQADEPDPELPSFAHRHGVAPQAKAPAEPAEDVESRKIPSAVTVPDDMDDDVEAEPGLLTQIVALPRPVLAKHAASLAPIAERLKALGNGDSGHKND